MIRLLLDLLPPFYFPVEATPSGLLVNNLRCFPFLERTIFSFDEVSSVLQRPPVVMFRFGVVYCSRLDVSPRLCDS